MATTLNELLPRDANLSSDNLLGRFLDYVAARRLTLYPAQESALLELFTGNETSANRSEQVTAVVGTLMWIGFLLGIEIALTLHHCRRFVREFIPTGKRAEVPGLMSDLRPGATIG